MAIRIDSGTGKAEVVVPKKKKPKKTAPATTYLPNGRPAPTAPPANAAAPRTGAVTSLKQLQEIYDAGKLRDQSDLDYLQKLAWTTKKDSNLDMHEAIEAARAFFEKNPSVKAGLNYDQFHKRGVTDRAQWFDDRLNALAAVDTLKRRQLTGDAPADLFEPQPKTGSLQNPGGPPNVLADLPPDQRPADTRLASTGAIPAEALPGDVVAQMARDRKIEGPAALTNKQMKMLDNVWREVFKGTKVEKGVFQMSILPVILGTGTDYLDTPKKAKAAFEALKDPYLVDPRNPYAIDPGTFFTFDDKFNDLMQGQIQSDPNSQAGAWQGILTPFANQYTTEDGDLVARRVSGESLHLSNEDTVRLDSLVSMVGPSLAAVPERMRIIAQTLTGIQGLPGAQPGEAVNALEVIQLWCKQAEDPNDPITVDGKTWTPAMDEAIKRIQFGSALWRAVASEYKDEEAVYYLQQEWGINAKEFIDKKLAIPEIPDSETVKNMDPAMRDYWLAEMQKSDEQRKQELLTRLAIDTKLPGESQASAVYKLWKVNKNMVMPEYASAFDKAIEVTHAAENAVLAGRGGLDVTGRRNALGRMAGSTPNAGVNQPILSKAQRDDIVYAAINVPNFKLYEEEKKRGTSNAPMVANKGGAVNTAAVEERTGGGGGGLMGLLGAAGQAWNAVVHQPVATALETAQTEGGRQMLAAKEAGQTEAQFLASSPNTARFAVAAQTVADTSGQAWSDEAVQNMQQWTEYLSMQRLAHPEWKDDHLSSTFAMYGQTWDQLRARAGGGFINMGAYFMQEHDPNYKPGDNLLAEFFIDALYEGAVLAAPAKGFELAKTAVRSNTAYRAAREAVLTKLHIDTVGQLAADTKSAYTFMNTWGMDEHTANLMAEATTYKQIVDIAADNGIDVLKFDPSSWALPSRVKLGFRASVQQHPLLERAFRVVDRDLMGEAVVLDGSSARYVYDHALAMGMTGKEAQEFADEAVRIAAGVSQGADDFFARFPKFDEVLQEQLRRSAQREVQLPPGVKPRTGKADPRKSGRLEAVLKHVGSLKDQRRALDQEIAALQALDLSKDAAKAAVRDADVLRRVNELNQLNHNLRNAEKFLRENGHSLGRRDAPMVGRTLKDGEVVTKRPAFTMSEQADIKHNLATFLEDFDQLLVGMRRGIRNNDPGLEKKFFKADRKAYDEEMARTALQTARRDGGMEESDIAEAMNDPAFIQANGYISDQRLYEWWTEQVRPETRQMKQRLEGRAKGQLFGPKQTGSIGTTVETSAPTGAHEAYQIAKKRIALDREIDTIRREMNKVSPKRAAFQTKLVQELRQEGYELERAHQVANRIIIRNLADDLGLDINDVIAMDNDGLQNFAKEALMADVGQDVVDDWMRHWEGLTKGLASQEITTKAANRVLASGGKWAERGTQEVRSLMALEQVQNRVIYFGQLTDDELLAASEFLRAARATGNGLQEWEARLARKQEAFTAGSTRPVIILPASPEEAHHAVMNQVFGGGEAFQGGKKGVKESYADRGITDGTTTVREAVQGKEMGTVFGPELELEDTGLQVRQVTNAGNAESKTLLEEEGVHFEEEGEPGVVFPRSDGAIVDAGDVTPQVKSYASLINQHISFGHSEGRSRVAQAFDEVALKLEADAADLEANIATLKSPLSKARARAKVQKLREQASKMRVQYDNGGRYLTADVRPFDQSARQKSIGFHARLKKGDKLVDANGDEWEFREGFRSKDGTQTGTKRTWLQKVNETYDEQMNGGVSIDLWDSHGSGSPWDDGGLERLSAMRKANENPYTAFQRKQLQTVKWDVWHQMVTGEYRNSLHLGEKELKRLRSEDFGRIRQILDTRVNNALYEIRQGMSTMDKGLADLIRSGDVRIRLTWDPNFNAVAYSHSMAYDGGRLGTISFNIASDGWDNPWRAGAANQMDAFSNLRLHGGGVFIHEGGHAVSSELWDGIYDAVGSAPLPDHIAGEIRDSVGSAYGMTNFPEAAAETYAGTVHHLPGAQDAWERTIDYGLNGGASGAAPIYGFRPRGLQELGADVVQNTTSDTMTPFARAIVGDNDELDAQLAVIDRVMAERKGDTAAWNTFRGQLKELTQTAQILDEVGINPTSMKTNPTVKGFVGEAGQPAAQPLLPSQLQEYYHPTYDNRLNLTWNTGRAARRMEMVNTHRIFGTGLTLDKTSQVFKTVILARLATAIRIVLGDEATRILPEQIDYFQARHYVKEILEAEKAGKVIIPPDIKSDLSRLYGIIRRTGYAALDPGDPEFIRSYSGMLRQWNGDPVVRGWRNQYKTALKSGLSEKEADAAARAWLEGQALTEGTPFNLHLKLTNRYWPAESTMKSVYGALGAEDQMKALRTAFEGQNVQDAIEAAHSQLSFFANNRWTKEHFLNGKKVKVDDFKGAAAAASKAGDLTEQLPIVMGRMFGDTPTGAGKYLPHRIFGNALEGISNNLSEATFAHFYMQERTRLTAMYFSKLHIVGDPSDVWNAHKLLPKNAQQAIMQDIETRAANFGREQVHRVMYTAGTSASEDLLRNVILFLPAQRQYIAYWAKAVWQHPWLLAYFHRLQALPDYLELKLPWVNDENERTRIFLRGLLFATPGFRDDTPGQKLYSMIPGLGIPGVIAGTVAGGMATAGKLSEREWMLAPQKAMMKLPGGSFYSDTYRPLNAAITQAAYGLSTAIAAYPANFLPEEVAGSNAANMWKLSEKLKAIVARQLQSGDYAHMPDARAVAQRDGLLNLAMSGWNFSVPAKMSIIDTDVQDMLDNETAWKATTTYQQRLDMLEQQKGTLWATVKQIELEQDPLKRQKLLYNNPGAVPYYITLIGPSNPEGEVYDFGEIPRKSKEALMSKFGMQEVISLRKEAESEERWFKKVYIPALRRREPWTGGNTTLQGKENNAYSPDSPSNIQRITANWEESSGSFGAGQIVDPKTGLVHKGLGEIRSRLENAGYPASSDFATTPDSATYKATDALFTLRSGARFVRTSKNWREFTDLYRISHKENEQAGIIAALKPFTQMSDTEIAAVFGKRWKGNEEWARQRVFSVWDQYEHGYQDWLKQRKDGKLVNQGKDHGDFRYTDYGQALYAAVTKEVWKVLVGPKGNDVIGAGVAQQLLYTPLVRPHLVVYEGAKEAQTLNATEPMSAWESAIDEATGMGNMAGPAGMPLTNVPSVLPATDPSGQRKIKFADKAIPERLIAGIVAQAVMDMKGGGTEPLQWDKHDQAIMAAEAEYLKTYMKTADPVTKYNVREAQRAYTWYVFLNNMKELSKVAWGVPSEYQADNGGYKGRTYSEKLSQSIVKQVKKKWLPVFFKTSPLFQKEFEFYDEKAGGNLIWDCINTYR